ncbi:protein-disulfide reductase DsbD domain-containing protein [Roseicyclus mahoneyensis]|uniref:Disulfide bond corrector protein DsbC n=1 Tax=Roseicyclus mahoneyensis TaxID=164332 RepID=A0A316GG29_9RHOB|nr:protein-disulfide reductase DsbD domain-containing protein [Roseicyclus mahoneyensis]PWK59875.1 disulfide bond corrector protein DsbC [Roseicyclus mahoneyensis]
MSFRSRLLATLVACAVPLTAAPALAQFEGRTAADVVQVTFLPGWRLPNGNHMAAVRITLAPGWKTYWRAPGEGGVPTVISLTEAQGVSGMAIHWPRPQVFFANGMRSIGYHDDVILPVEFALSETGEVSIAGQIDLGVCQDVCMPVTLDLAGLLPPGTDRVREIGAALSERPLTATEAGAGRATCSVEPIADGLQVTVSVSLPPTGNDETIVVEHRHPDIWVSEAVTRREGGTVSGTADIVPADHGPFALNRSDLRITVIGSRMAVELDGCTG